MSKAKDAIGSTYGRWTVISYKGIVDEKDYVECQCVCGTKRTIMAWNLFRGLTKSCGCLRRELQIKRNTTHGEVRSKEFKSWSHMKSRCYTKTDHKYPSYGARGITVCERWLGKDGFINFLADMGRKPTPQHTLERKNNDGNYEPSNCKWATQKEQAGNRRSNTWHEYNGEEMIQADWAARIGLHPSTLASRLRTKSLAQIIQSHI